VGGSGSGFSLTQPTQKKAVSVGIGAKQNSDITPKTISFILNQQSLIAKVLKLLRFRIFKHPEMLNNKNLFRL
jgi:hypothetical protein